jgi:hypothetical protein
MKVEFITKEDFEQFKSDISEMLSRLSSNTNNETWLRSREVREMLGISNGTLQNMRIHGHIPYSKVGGSLFYKLTDLENVLEKNKVG